MKTKAQDLPVGSAWITRGGEIAVVEENHGGTGNDIGTVQPSGRWWHYPNGRTSRSFKSHADLVRRAARPTTPGTGDGE